MRWPRLPQGPQRACLRVFRLYVSGLPLSGSPMRIRRLILLGLWRGLDGLRKFLHLLLLLILFGFIIGALRGATPSIPAKAALLVAPEGEIVEQLSGDAIQRALQQARGQGRPETL